jgi:hypothetical protein
MTSPEAPLLKRSNVLKEAASDELLTGPQEQALEAIREHRNDNARFINLYGPRQSGKTFLCWVLQQSGTWEYHQANPDSVSSATVIYDHGEADRMATRRLRNHATINGVASVVYVTEKPAEELYPRIELEPSSDHYATIEDNWDSLGLDSSNAPTP